MFLIPPVSKKYVCDSFPQILSELNSKKKLLKNSSTFVDVIVKKWPTFFRYTVYNVTVSVGPHTTAHTARDIPNSPTVHQAPPAGWSRGGACLMPTVAHKDSFLPGGAENAGVENAGAITYRKPPEDKTLRYQ